MLRILWFGEKVDQKNCQTISPPPDMCGEKFPLVSMGGRAEGLACADPGARTPIGASGIFFIWRHCGGFLGVRQPHQLLLKFLRNLIIISYKESQFPHKWLMIQNLHLVYFEVSPVSPIWWKLSCSWWSWLLLWSRCAGKIVRLCQT